MRHGEIQAIELRHEERRAPASRCWQVQHSAESAALVLKDIQEALAAADVQTLPGGVVEQIVGVADRIHGGHDLAGGRVDDEHFGRLATADEETLARFVECHWEVR